MSDYQYLNEMGIQGWDLSHPERLRGYRAPAIALPDSCDLLFVSPQIPREDMAVMFGKVLKSMGLELNQARHIYPEQLEQLDNPGIAWIWFAGCETREMEGIKILTTPLLTDIDGNVLERRRLWQQICSYDISN